MKVRQPVDDQGQALAPFERPVAVWKALGAPADLWDPELAAKAELTHGAGPILRPGDVGFPGPAQFYAARWWRRHRPAFLQQAGQLTAAEARIVASRAGARTQRTGVRPDHL